MEKYGVGAMEIVAMEMKLRGMYIARQLSFEKAKFKVDKVVLSPDQVKLQEDSVNLWVELFHSFKAASKLVNSDPSADTFMWSQFWSSHQRYFKYLSIAAKVECAVEIASEAVKSGKCVVIGLQSTGEARTLEHIDDEGEISDFVSTAKGVLQALIEKHFPAIDSRVRSASLDEDSIDLESSGPGNLMNSYYRCGHFLIRFYFQELAVLNGRRAKRSGSRRNCVFLIASLVTKDHIYMVISKTYLLIEFIIKSLPLFFRT